MRVGNHATQPIYKKIDRAAMPGMLDLQDILELIKDRFDDGALASLGQTSKYLVLLDAQVVCVLAGLDFLDENVYHPIDLDAAKIEDWIWLGKPI